MTAAESIDSAARHLSLFAGALPAGQRAALDRLMRGPAPVDQRRSDLAELPAERILTPTEAALFRRLAGERADPHPGVRPALVMIMKSTRLCNLRCTYCNQWADGPNQHMGFPVLLRAIRDVLRAPGVRRVEFVWHGGEPTLRRREFFRKALWLQHQFRRPGQVVRNALQTNGTRLTPDWLAFLREHEFSVGVSLDGPAEIHDRRRLDVHGERTFDRVRAGLAALRAEGIPHGVLLVVDDEVVEFGAERLLHDLLELGVTNVDLLNALPKNTAIGAPAQGLYLEWERYVGFLRDVFRCWWPGLAGRIAIRELDGLVGQLAGGPPGTCVFAGDCFGAFLTVDPDGTVSACDKYVDDPDYVFGQLLRDDLAAILTSGRLDTVRRDNAAAVAARRSCPWFEVCHGGCPHDRYTSLRRQAGQDQSCCGFAPLLADMREVTRSAPVGSTPRPHTHQQGQGEQQ